MKFFVVDCLYVLSPTSCRTTLLSFTIKRSYEMSTLLFAVDEKETRVREDGFILEISENSPTLARLTVGTVIPPFLPNNGTGNQAFIDHINLPRKTPYTRHLKLEPFFDTRSRISFGFSEFYSRQALCATYSIDDSGYLTDRLEIVPEVTVEVHTYQDFSRKRTFGTLNENMKLFLQQDSCTWKFYQDVRETHQNDPNVTEGNLMVFGLMDLFNATCSAYAEEQGIPTLHMDRFGVLTFMIRKKAKFTSPLRNARGFVNITNLLSYMREGELLYTESILRSMGARIC